MIPMSIASSNSGQFLASASPSSSSSSSSSSSCVLIDKPTLSYVALRSKNAFRRCLSCRYLKANVVYFFYMLALMGLDSKKGQTPLYDELMFALCFVHLFDALLYLWMWLELMSLKHFLLTPDWLNLLGALLYITSTSMYKYQFENTGNSSNSSEEGDKTIFFGIVRRLELSASILELLMSFGWVWQWFVEYRSDLVRDPFSCIGRGFTLDDPDLWANITLVVAASYYLAYNVTVFIDYSKYDYCNLYIVGDQWYFVNSIFYLLCSLRDNEVFWFCPHAGKLPDVRQMAETYYYSHEVAATTNSAVLVTSASSSPTSTITPRSRTQSSNTASISNNNSSNNTRISEADGKNRGE